MTKLIVGFDFDGTLYLSNEIKKQAFYLTVNKYEKAEIVVKEILLKNPVLNRYEFFDLFTKIYKKKCLDSNLLDPKKLSDDYTKICFSKITQAAKSRKGMHQLLEYLLEHSVNCYLISATPVRDLKNITSKLKLDKFFKAVLGAPDSKEYLIQRIIEKEKIYKNNFFYVGDKLNDYDASKNVGCSFIPISDDDEFKKLNIKVFNNLYDLINIFKTKI